MRITEALRRTGRAVRRGYEPLGETRPLGGYVRALATYGALFGGLARVVSRRHDAPAEMSNRDIVLGAVATFRAARLLTQANVTSPLRAPVARYEGVGAPGEVHEEVKEPTGGARHALGEFVTCPYCMGMWVATAFAFGTTLTPRWTRFVASLLTVEAGADALQKLYSDLQAR